MKRKGLRNESAITGFCRKNYSTFVVTVAPPCDLYIFCEYNHAPGLCRCPQNTRMRGDNSDSFPPSGLKNDPACPFCSNKQYQVLTGTRRREIEILAGMLALRLCSWRFACLEFSLKNSQVLWVGLICQHVELQL